MTTTGDRVLRTPPTLEDYLRLRRTSGLTPRSATQGEGALAGSWAWSVVEHEGRAVAMGRVIGDGGWYFHVADMAALPEHQGRGLGRLVLTDLLAQIAEAAPPDPYVTLMADAPDAACTPRWGSSRQLRDPSAWSSWTSRSRADRCARGPRAQPGRFGRSRPSRSHSGLLG